MAEMNDLEKKLQESRTIEATKKNLMGINGKLGCIVMALGFPVIEQSGAGNGLWDDMYSLLQKGTAKELNDAIPTMYEEYKDKDNRDSGVPVSSPYSKEWRAPPEHHNFHIGLTGQWNFDGLSRGMHMEIRFKEAENELCVWYRGYPVYREINGTLEGYNPKPEWEGWVDRLYAVARKTQKKTDAVEYKEDVEKTKKRKLKWWQRILDVWGE